MSHFSMRGASDFFRMQVPIIENAEAFPILCVRCAR